MRRLHVRVASLLRLHGEHLSAAAEALSRELNGDLCGRTLVRGPRAFALGNAEWLLIDYSRESIRRSLRPLGRALVRITDVSSSLVSFAIEGPASRSVLGIDDDPIWQGAAQSSGQYARTRFGDVAVVLQCTGPDSFELHSDRDPLDHLAHWIRQRYVTRLLRSPSKCH